MGIRYESNARFEKRAFAGGNKGKEMLRVPKALCPLEGEGRRERSGTSSLTDGATAIG
jgi:hypothetical protein